MDVNGDEAYFKVVTCPKNNLTHRAEFWPDFLSACHLKPHAGIYSEADSCADVKIYSKMGGTVDTHANAGLNSEMPAWMFNSREKRKAASLRVSFRR